MNFRDFKINLIQLRNALRNIITKHWRDIVICFVVAFVSAGFAYFRNSLLHPVIYSYGNETRQTSDMWFDGDIPKNLLIMTDRGSSKHSITSEHPFMSAILYLPTYVLKEFLGFSPLQAVRVYLFFSSFLWTAMLFILLRTLGCRLVDATILTLIGITSSSAIFWFAVPELFPLGSISILLSILLLVIPFKNQTSLIKFYAINLVSFSITVTNWMVGIFSSFLNLSKRIAFQVIIGSFGLASMLWYFQKAIFPKSEYFFIKSDRLYEEFYYWISIDRIWHVVRSIFLYTVVMPTIDLRESSNWLGMSIQYSELSLMNAAGFIAVISWILLLGLGMYCAFSEIKKDRVIALVGLTLIGQIGIHTILGRETFLYSMHFLPLLLIFASRVFFTRFRTLGLILAIILLVSGLINNYQEFNFAVSFIDSIGRLVPDLQFVE